MANRLATATSPYLLQHADNPVAWWPWCEDALAEARRRDVPVLLSVGYAACHWCHVMAHESFESAATAELMNRLFVSIKVDREERPDIDAIYQQALAAMGQQGGWPLTMFLAPDGSPFWGGTYFPPEPRYGRAGFPQVLEHISRLWGEERHKAESNREALRDALGRLANPEAGEAPGPDLAVRLARSLAERFDTIHGGLAGAPKFPQAPILDLLWQAALATGDPVLRRRVLHTLQRICQGGIYDHLGGGFARYSVDALWLVPHFEKMLYDNAQLLRLLGDAWAVTDEPLFAERARETVAWLQREMMVGDAFASSLDADSEGEEGRFYVWEAAEIDRLLGAAATGFRLAYGITAAGNWEGRTVLNRLHEPGLPPAEERPALAAAQSMLLEARERRPRPGRDDKVLADWNGLMIEALAGASVRLGEPEWLAMAERAFAWIVARLGDGDRLCHSWRDGRRLPIGFLDDYAAMGNAAVALFEQTGTAGYLAQAGRWTARLDAEFRTGSGAYATTAASGEALVVRATTAQDGPVQSGNAALVLLSARLAALTGDDAHRRRAEAILSAFGGDVRSSPFGHASLLTGALHAARPVQIVLIDGPGRDELLAVVVARPVAGAVLHPIRGEAALPAAHPAAGKSLVGGRATAYICIGGTCRAPVNEPEALRQALADLVMTVD